MIAVVSCLFLTLLSPDDARTVGRQLLVDQKWEEAGEIYGARYPWSTTVYPDWEGRIPLEEEIAAVWHSHSDRPQVDRDRFHFHLTNFYFRHTNLDRWLLDTRWRHVVAHMERLVLEYPRWIAAVPEAQREGALDLSHMDLLAWAEELPRGHPFTDEEKERFLGALQANPESVPATLAYLIYLHMVEGDEVMKTIVADRESVTGQFPRLALARKVALDWSGDEYFVKITLEGAWEIAPSREEKALLLFARAVIEPTFDEEKRLTRLCVDSFPDTLFCAHARCLHFNFVLAEGGPDACLVEIRRLQESGHRGKAGMEYGLVWTGVQYFGRGDRKKAETLLLEVADHPAGPSWDIGEGLIYLSQIYRDRGERAEAIRWLERSVDTAPANEEAIRLLVSLYEADDRWMDAYRVWEKLETDGWDCGAAVVASRQRKAAEMARYKAATGDGPGAVADIVAYLTDPERMKWEGESSPWELSTALFEIYRNADQLDDFRAILPEIEARRGGGRLDGAREVLAVRGLDLEGLIAACRRNCRVAREEACRELLRLGEEAVGPVLRAARDGGSWRSSFLEVLAQHPDGLEALASLAGEEHPERYGSSQHWKEKLGEALARKGEEGRAVLRKIASDDRSPLQQTAQDWLEKEPPRLPRDLPVKPGSLPRSL